MSPSLLVPGLTLALLLAVGGSLRAQTDPAYQAAMERARQQEAEMLLDAGDEAFEGRDFEDAVIAYGEALELLPESSEWQLWRESTAERWLQAAAGAARQLVGSQQAGRAEDLLAPLVTHPLTREDPRLAEAVLLVEAAKEPGSTPGFRADLVEVEELLALGESQVRVGLYDEAEVSAHRILHLDPYNAAARRLLERVAREKLEYDRAAYDHSRSEMLEAVEAGWEMPVPILEPDRELGPAGRVGSGGAAVMHAELDRLVLDRIELVEMALGDVLELLRLRAADLGGSVNIIFLGDDREVVQRPISLNLQQVTLADLLDFVAELSSTTWGVERGAVVFRSGSSGQRVFSEAYEVPPGLFLSLTLDPAGAGEDPFASAAASGPRQVDARGTLESLGIEFSESNSVTYARASSLLTFTGTAEQHSLLQEVLDEVRNTGERQVQVKVTVMRVMNFEGDELSFDTLLGAANIPGTERAFFSGGTYGNSVQGVSSRQYPFLLPGTTDPVGSNPISGGLRSGTEVFARDGISDAIAEAAGFATPDQLEAPGIFSLAGVFTDVQWQFLMRGLNQNKATDFLTTPTVIGRNGQQIQISQKREIRYPSDFDPPELPDSIGVTEIDGIRVDIGYDSYPVTPAQPREFVTSHDGINLDILPTISPDGQSVVLDLSPQFRILEGFINYGVPITQPGPAGNIQVVTPNRILQPVFRNFELKTQVTVYDGQTLVIGGLLRDDIIEFVDKVPLFGDIPVLGRLFQSRGRELTREALLFTVSVDILDPGGRLIRE